MTDGMTDPTDKTDDKDQGPAIADPPSTARASVGAKDVVPDENEDDAVSPDLEDRVLCPDGACIGIIGPDGRCKECGQRAEPAAHQPPAKQAVDPGSFRVEPDGGVDLDDDVPDLSDRTLCSDGACIGVIGPDGKCKECGKPFEGTPRN